VNQALQRLRDAWAALEADQRFAGLAALALLATMFLPWYEKSAVVGRTGRFATDSLSAFGVVSFVEAAIFLVSAGVVALVLARGERRAFHLPGGDGTVILAAGAWAALLLFYRVFDRPSAEGVGATVGIQWGFFCAFVAAGALAFAGSRIRAAHRPEPGDDEVPGPTVDPTTATVVRRRTPTPSADAGQLSFDEQPDRPLAPGEIPPARRGS
jgi:hypothetical protein